MFLRLFAPICLAFMLLACRSDANVPPPEPTSERTAERNALATMMTGSFSSAAQAEADTTYFDIRLEMVPIWADRTDGPWLYVEQAAASALDEPYRQRVYQLRTDGVGVRSIVYELPDPMRFAGDWADPNPLVSLSPDSLLLREGCAVYLEPQSDGTWSGSTAPRACKSVLRGASYATSSVTVHPDRIESWDQGFDSTGVQVWGATEGGYVFVNNNR